MKHEVGFLEFVGLAGSAVASKQLSALNGEEDAPTYRGGARIARGGSVEEETR